MVSKDQISIFDNFSRKKINYDLESNFIDEPRTAIRMRSIIALDESKCLLRPDEYAVDEGIYQNDQYSCFTPA